jgi:hypothetical protein
MAASFFSASSARWMKMMLSFESSQPASDDGDGGDALVNGVVQIRAEPFVGLGEVVSRGAHVAGFIAVHDLPTRRNPRRCLRTRVS